MATYLGQDLSCLDYILLGFVAFSTSHLETFDIILSS